MKNTSLLCLGLLFVTSGAVAQELTPRAYWPAPRGTQILVVGYNYSSGDIVTDPSLPVVGVDSSINLGLLAYVGYFSLAGRTANKLGYSTGVVTESGGDYDMLLVSYSRIFR